MAGAAEHGKIGPTIVPALYVVATPIGNLQDVTLRALDVLKRVDAIAAEDTRVTAKLLGHYAIGGKKLIALHEHNERRAAERIIGEVKAGSSVALTTDAGTPAISDPGARLVAAAREAGLAVVPVPGPNAAITALSASGFVQPQFLFYGFLPSKRAERRAVLDSLRRIPYLLVLYEAPHRVVETLEDLAALFGEGRRIAVARELTKLFESIHVCELGAASSWIGAEPNRSKGEFVLIVEGAESERDDALADARRTLEILLEELPVKQAAQMASRITGVRRNELYRLALQLKREPVP
jgi:16S rRNA (cytidine1402-2'-O)-methyltransferase